MFPGEEVRNRMGPCLQILLLILSTFLKVSFEAISLGFESESVQKNEIDALGNMRLACVILSRICWTMLRIVRLLMFKCGFKRARQQELSATKSISSSNLWNSLRRASTRRSSVSRSVPWVIPLHSLTGMLNFEIKVKAQRRLQTVGLFSALLCKYMAMPVLDTAPSVATIILLGV